MNTGAITGYQLADAKGLNYWWGNTPKYNGNGTYKSPWAFWNVDKPDIIIFDTTP